jgi:DNA-binding MarR family transcriptional regulator
MKNSDIKIVGRFTHVLEKFKREQEFHQRYSCCKGLTLAQCHALLEIGNLDQPSLIQLADSLNLDKSTVSRTVDGLTNLDMVDRYVPYEDRRTLLLSLSKKGKETYDDINLKNNTYFNEVLSVIPLKEREAFINTLELMTDTMAAKNSNYKKKILS